MTPLPTALPTDTPARLIPTPGRAVSTPTSPTVTPEATETPLSPPTVESASPGISSSPENAWMDLPVLPSPAENVREIYRRGLSLGNNPNAISIFGDCQARPEEFFGIYETDPLALGSLPPELRDVVNHFHGSFNRESPTTRDGTTPGALLWTQWHLGRFGCTFAETPVQCELRIHNPSFVIIQIGTHFESRNTEYLRRIIRQLIENGVAPILATKADNRELDHRINRDMALLASEFNLPLWNFWAALNDLPNRGLYTREDRPHQGDIYLTAEAQEIQRRTGLEALNIVWRAATGQ
ncbi:MAG TPA: SGNH/GDSL hydrolase family protein [Anaerolineales bacterium]|nr:SGNH/GDSL hydrolase family protein [Anaerolineales bacterium]